jgi:hypothetical protein
MVVTAHLRNASPCPWNELTLSLRPTMPGGPPLTLLPGQDAIHFDDIAAQADALPVTGSDQIRLRVLNAGVTALRASILNGSRFTSRGRELWVFRHPIVVLDSGLANLVMSNWLPDYGNNAFRLPLFSDNTIVLEHEEVYAFPIIREPLELAGLIDTGFGGKYRQHPLKTDLPLPYFIGEIVDPNSTTAGCRECCVMLRVPRFRGPTLYSIWCATAPSAASWMPPRPVDTG